MTPRALINKLNATCQKALTEAIATCNARGHFNVELEHWLLALLNNTNNDLAFLLRQYAIDAAKVKRELEKALERFKTGNTRGTPALGEDVLNATREAWVLGSLEQGANRVRSAHLIAAALSPGGKTPAFDQFTVNLTANAKAGKIDPVLGRDHEIRQVIDILTRRRQNNPILIGEAGVGKTAVVEGLAMRIKEGDVPEPLRNVALHTLDLGLLQPGAGVKREFENRLKSVIDEVKRSPTPIILFIDEAPTLIGAGGAAGQNDAANLLKPALARGELRTIAATTFAEYKKYFETDAALKRRFQQVKVDEPDEQKAIRMLRGLVPMLEKHHKVRILDVAVVEAEIIRLKLNQIGDRLRQNYKAAFAYTDAVVDLIASRCKDVDTGARNADHIITGTVLTEISAQVLSRIAEGKPVKCVKVDADDNSQLTYLVE